MTDQVANPEGGGNVDQPSSPPAWTAQLSGELRENQSLTSFQNISEMGKAYLNTRGEVTELQEKLSSAILKPGENATPEDLEAYYASLGRPENAEMYSFKAPEGLPEGAYNAETEAAFKQLAFQNGLTDQQANQLHGWFWQNMQAGMQATKERTDTAINQLKGEWKDKFEANAVMANRAFDKFGGNNEDVQKLVNSHVDGVALKDHPVFAKIFYEISKVISDDLLSDGESHGGRPQSDEAVARQMFPNTKFPQS